jgi:hypothetical protein
MYVQDDQKISVHLMITIQSADVQRLFLTVVPCILMLSNHLLVQLMHNQQTELICGHVTEQFNNAIY